MKKSGLLCLIIGILCLVLAAGLFLYNRREDADAGETAFEAVPRIVAQMPDPDLLPEEALPEESGDMPAIEVDGHSYIGMVTIPVLELELPIQAEWSPANAKLSPCRYKGSMYDQNLIIAGHNYKSHFGRLKELNSGDQVIITDVNGKSYSYEVSYTETIPTEGVEEMDAGDWDLTVFTCTVGGASRVTVRCTFTGEVSYYSMD